MAETGPSFRVAPMRRHAMTERKPHPDNALIDELERDATPSHGGRAGGGTAREAGGRSELRNTAGVIGNERPRAQDNTEAVNESKGDKAIGRLAPENNG